MDTHRRRRLIGVLEAEGLYAVFTRRGTALVIPFIDTTGVASDNLQVDHLACYGKFFFEYADEPGEIGRKIRDWTRAPAASPGDALASVLGDLGVLGRRIGLDEGNLFAPTWKRVEERLAGTTPAAPLPLVAAARQGEGPDEIA